MTCKKLSKLIPVRLIKAKKKRKWAVSATKGLPPMHVG